MITDGLLAALLLGAPHLISGLSGGAGGLTALLSLGLWFYAARPTWRGLYQPALTGLLILNLPLRVLLDFWG